MKWSIYNNVFRNKYGVFIYNSLTNSFIKINESIKSIIDQNNFSKLSENVINTFIKYKILIYLNEDEDYYLNSKMKKMRLGFSKESLNLTIAPTTLCNFRCPYCYEKGIKGLSMNRNIENQIIEFIKKSDSRRLIITWYGGEPLIKFNAIKRIMSYLSSCDKFSKITYNMVTNGFLLSKETCNYLKNYDFNNIQITIDGLADTHNKSRIHKNGMDTFNTIMTNIDYALNELPNCKFSIRVNINVNNQEDYHLLRDHLKNRWEGKNFVVYHSFVDTLSGCDQECFTSQNKINFIKDLFEKYNSEDVDIYPTHEIGGCGANLINSFVIGPDGSLYKCWADIGKVGKRIGTIYNNEATNSSLLSKYMLESDKYSDLKCKTCSIFPICDGGCSLKRFENKFENKDIVVCPYFGENIQAILELYYKNSYLSV